MYSVDTLIEIPLSQITVTGGSAELQGGFQSLSPRLVYLDRATTKNDTVTADLTLSLSGSLLDVFTSYGFISGGENHRAIGVELLYRSAVVVFGNATGSPYYDNQTGAWEGGTDFDFNSVGKRFTFIQENIYIPDGSYAKVRLDFLSEIPLDSINEILLRSMYKALGPPTWAGTPYNYVYAVRVKVRTDYQGVDPLLAVKLKGLSKSPIGSSFAIAYSPPAPVEPTGAVNVCYTRIPFPIPSGLLQRPVVTAYAGETDLTPYDVTYKATGSDDQGEPTCCGGVDSIVWPSSERIGALYQVEAGEYGFTATVDTGVDGMVKLTPALLTVVGADCLQVECEPCQIQQE